MAENQVESAAPVNEGAITTEGTATEAGGSVESEGEVSTEAPVSRSKYEDQALEMGWRPQTEWTGDAEDFVTAKEFVQRKSFFDKIATQNAEIKELKKNIEQLTDHHKKVEEYTRKQVLTDLNKAKQRAYEEGNAAEVAKIDEAIVDFKLNEVELRRQAEVESQRKAGVAAPEVAEWQDRNSWYLKDSEMTSYVDTFTAGFLATHPDAKKDPAAVLALIDKEVRARFPDKFKNARRTAPAAVEGNNGTGAKPKEAKIAISDEERRIAQKFVNRGLYKSVDDYVKELRKNGDK
jgi:hypothetical protein